jgi:hypothetical protein
MRWDATVRRSAARDVRAAIADAGRRAVEPLTLELDVVRQIDRVVPFDRWCGLVTDPVTAHPTGGYHDEGLPPPRLPRLLEIENGDEPDFVSLRALARSRTRARTLGEATKGDLARSPRYRDVLEPSGVRHEVRVALRCSSGAWGALVLMRGTDAPDFTPAEVDLLSAVSPVVAEGLCRTIVLGRRPTAPGTGPGLLLCTVGDEISVDHANEPARRRLTELDDASTGGLPYSIACLVQSARHQPAGLGPWRARMRTRTHEWITVHAERLGPTLVSVIPGAHAATRDRSALGRRARPDRARTRGHRPGRPGTHQCADRRRALPLPVHRPGLPEADLHQDRRRRPHGARGGALPRGRGPAAVGTRAARRRGTLGPRPPARRPDLSSAG